MGRKEEKLLLRAKGEMSNAQVMNASPLLHDVNYHFLLFLLSFFIPGVVMMMVNMLDIITFLL